MNYLLQSHIVAPHAHPVECAQEVQRRQGHGCIVCRDLGVDLRHMPRMPVIKASLENGPAGVLWPNGRRPPLERWALRPIQAHFTTASRVRLFLSLAEPPPQSTVGLYVRHLLRERWRARSEG
jgi:hypothetical protein